MFYLYIFLILTGLAFYEILFNPKDKNRLYFCVFVLLTFISGFRYETGVDWVAYEYEMDRAISLSDAITYDKWEWLSNRLDFGYSILMALIKMIGGGIQTLFFVVAFLTQYLLYLNLKRYSAYVLFSYLVYYTFFFFIFDLSGIRQALAIQIFLYSIRFINEKKFSKYLLYIILATSIHWTAIVLIFLYLFINKRVSGIVTIIIIIFSTSVFTAKLEWLGIVMGDILAKVNSYSLLEAKVKGYTTYDQFAKERGWNAYSIYTYLKLIVILFLTYVNRDKIKENLPSVNIFYNLAIMEFICIYTFYEFYEMSERFKFYFLISEVILFSHILYIMYPRYKKQMLSVSFVIIVFFNSYIYLLGYPTAVAYNPYQNYLYYKAMDKKSDGYQRFRKHIQVSGGE